MKHAFIFGTTIFLSEQTALTFADGDNRTEFLKINTFYINKQGFENRVLSIDADILSPDGDAIHISGNQLEAGASTRIETTDNRIKVFKTGHEEPVLDVYQLDEHEYHGLSSHVLNEIEAQHPDAVLTIKGNFKIGGSHISIENEKMFIDDNGFANGVVNAHNGVILSAVDLDS